MKTRNPAMIATCKLKYLFLLALTLSTPSQAASVGTGGVGAAFGKGTVSLGLVAGTGTAYRNDYLILGAGLGYYVLNGLELGISLQHWFGDDPSISKLSPSVRYVFTQFDPVKPYLGAFYRRTYIENNDDYDSFGYRAGAYLSGSRGVYIGGGIVYEEYTDCTQFLECSDTYPEIVISINF
jgi:hypothetical protein